MKKLFEYCNQKRPYADREGYCLIELEKCDTVEDVFNTWVAPEREWYERTYSDPKEINRYKYEGKVYTGNLVLMKVFEVYTG